MNLKHIGLALAALGSGVTLSACKKNKDATEVPGASGRGGEGGCGSKKAEAGCGAKKKESQEDAGGEEEAGCGAKARAAGKPEDAPTLSAQGPEPEAVVAPEEEQALEAALAPSEPQGPTDAKVEAVSDTNPLSDADLAKPKKKRRRRRRKPKKRRRAAAEEVCGEGTCG